MGAQVQRDQPNRAEAASSGVMLVCVNHCERDLCASPSGSGHGI